MAAAAAARAVGLVWAGGVQWVHRLRALSRSLMTCGLGRAALGGPDPAGPARMRWRTDALARRSTAQRAFYSEGEPTAARGAMARQVRRDAARACGRTACEGAG